MVMRFNLETALALMPFRFHSLASFSEPFNSNKLLTLMILIRYQIFIIHFWISIYIVGLLLLGLLLLLLLFVIIYWELYINIYIYVYIVPLTRSPWTLWRNIHIEYIILLSIYKSKKLKHTLTIFAENMSELSLQIRLAKSTSAGRWRGNPVSTRTCGR